MATSGLAMPWMRFYSRSASGVTVPWRTVPVLVNLGVLAVHFGASMSGLHDSWYPPPLV